MDEILKQICKSAYIYVHIECKQVNHHPQSLLFWFVCKSRNDKMDKTSHHQGYPTYAEGNQPDERTKMQDQLFIYESSELK